MAKLHSATGLDVKTLEDNEDSIEENHNARYTIYIQAAHRVIMIRLLPFTSNQDQSL